ncbi:hypothetical protein uav_062 [Pseudomonas phage UAVern]|uniref:Uncharacterized protein n=1 Tax=Pseudomonas phage UAVern TaxID=2856997 RepID=A0A975UX10_9CAUD|nr:hypothetical protein uav_062 [Pseudomonas phage UAVern]
MFQAGDRVRLTALGEQKYENQAKGSTGTVTKASTRGWTDVKWDNGHENNYELEDLFVAVRVVPVETPKEAAEAESRIKYLYSVETVDGVKITATADREHARQVKAYCGGKKEGVIIMAYAPVKEIR